LTEGQHLSPEIIAAWLAHRTSPEERQVVLQHLLVCAECRRDVDEAKTLSTGRRPPRWAAVAIPAAAAAVALWFLVPARPGAPPTSTLRGSGAEGVRQFAAVTPAGGASVAGDSVVFLWRSEGPGAHYVLTVTDEKGDVVWTAPTADTTLVPPREVGLVPGQRYYWYVDALLEDARSSTTGVQEFGIRR
jgi:hypothetical protein